MAGTKTANVLIERAWPHPLYRKVVRRRKKVLAHVEGEELLPGAKVIVEEARPLSRRKRWRVIKVENEGKPKK
jgi:small subunit ribosomal protein S17